MSGDFHGESDTVPIQSIPAPSESTFPALREAEPEFHRLYELGEAARFGLSAENFVDILSAIVRKHCPNDCSFHDIREFLASLKVGDLALARGCAAGNEAAWEELLTRYRAPLYELASSIARDDVKGRELADSLYTELYGLNSKGDQRPSKLLYYTGTGSLMGWLRTVLAQGYIDRYRQDSKLVSMTEDDDDDGEGRSRVVPEPVTLPEVETRLDPRLGEATETALASMSAEDRLILSSYFLDGHRLTDIAGLLGVHESTISRRLEKITSTLNKKIRVALLKFGFTKREVEEAFSTDVRELQVNVRERLQQNREESLQKTDSGSFYTQKAPGTKGRK